MAHPEATQGKLGTQDQQNGLSNAAITKAGTPVSSTPIAIPPVIQADGTDYYPLTPLYYAWLYRRMVAARRAYQSGKLAAGPWDALRNQFNQIQAWAVERYGKQPLQEAIDNPQANDGWVPVSAGNGQASGQVRDETPGDARVIVHNEPPSEPTQPADEPPAVPQPSPAGQLLPPYQSPVLPFAHPVPASAIAKVDAIRQHALSLGWSMAELYQNTGHFPYPCGWDYGLVCFVDGPEMVGEVTEQYVQLILPAPGNHRQSVQQSFYRRI